jgi:hypothetical protein
MDYGGHNMTVPLVVGRDLSLSGNLSLSGLPGGDIKVGGNWTHTTGNFVPKSRAVFFNGPTGNQTITATGGETFDFLLVDKTTSGNILPANDINVNLTLTLSKGRIILGSHNLTLGASSPAVAGTPGVNNMVVADGSGELRKIFTTNGLYEFPVGDVSGPSNTAEYAPVTLNFASGTYVAGAYAAIKVTDAKHANNASTTNFLSRYWTATALGITAFSCTLTGTFPNADINGTVGDMKTGKWNGTLPWQKYGAVTETTITAASVISFSDFTGITAADPTVTIAAVPSLTVCQNAVLTLTANAVGDAPFTYLWSPGGATTASINPLTSTNGSTSYTVTVSDGNGVTATSTAKITVNAVPVATASSNSPVCSGDTLHLYGGPDGMNSYSWLLPDGTVISSYANTVTQNFNSLNNSSSVWVDNSTISGWYSQRTGTENEYQAGDGNSPTGDLYNFGTEGSTERALGSVGHERSETGGFAHGILYQNTSGQTLTNINVTYTLEQWRNSGVGAAQAVTVWYKTSATAITNLTPNTASGWTNLPGLTLNSPINTTVEATALDGNSPANRITATNESIPGISLPNNQYIMIKWEDPDHPGLDHGLGIDDVSITCGTGDVQNLSIPNATTLMSGNYTLSITDTNGCINTASTAVTVNPKPLTSPIYHQ